MLERREALTVKAAADGSPRHVRRDEDAVAVEHSKSEQKRNRRVNRIARRKVVEKAHVGAARDHSATDAENTVRTRTRRAVQRRAPAPRTSAHCRQRTRRWRRRRKVATTSTTRAASFESTPAFVDGAANDDENATARWRDEGATARAAFA